MTSRPAVRKDAPMPEFADLGRILVANPDVQRTRQRRTDHRPGAGRDPEVHILIADDNSPDGTGALADRLAATDDHVHVMHRLGKEGLGAAYLAGFQWALDNGYDVIVEMDADGSHRPEELHRLLARPPVRRPGARLALCSGR